MKVKLPAIFSGIKSRKDRSYRLEFDTRELRGEDASQLLNMQMNESWLVISTSDDITEQDIPDSKANSGLGEKSPSQRLRGVIFILWQQNGQPSDFETYYKSKMESIIDLLKQKLD